MNCPHVVGSKDQCCGNTDKSNGHCSEGKTYAEAARDRNVTKTVLHAIYASTRKKENHIKLVTRTTINALYTGLHITWDAAEQDYDSDDVTSDSDNVSIAGHASVALHDDRIATKGYHSQPDLLTPDSDQEEGAE